MCLDITRIDHKHCVFCVLDLAARNIVGHCFSDNYFQVSDIINTLYKTFKDRDFLPKVQIVHSDRESLFKNQAYYEFLNKQSIDISRASAKGHENQVIERTFRTIKDITRKKLNITDKSINLDHFENFTARAVFIKQVIEDYNNKPHKALYGMTPNNMEEALFVQNSATQIIDNDLLPALTKNDNGEIANQVKRFKQTIVQDYCQSYIGDPHKFFIEFRKETQSGLNGLVLQNNTLYQQNLNMKKQLDFVESELQIMKDQRMSKEKRALKRKNAIAQNIRDSVNEEEFKGILDLVKANSFVASRRKTALLLLYVTGLRVSNLLVLKIKHIKDLLDHGQTQIPLIKKGNKQHDIILSNKSSEWLKAFANNFYQLMIHKERDSFFFTTQNNTEKPINRSSFDNELNHVLSKASEKYSKHIRTHSFRASIITDFLKNTPIDVVKEIVGHKDIGTTLQYKRGNLDNIQIKKILQDLDRNRSVSTAF